MIYFERFHQNRFTALSLSFVCTLANFLVASAGELHIGAATVDITPHQPVALDGQRLVRISAKPASPIQATVLAFESRDGERMLDQAIMVSCDLVAIRDGILHQVRDKLADRLKAFDLRKLFLSATHTHTAPVTIDGKYELPEKGIMPPASYADWMTSRIADGIVEAWQQRRPGNEARRLRCGNSE